MRPRIHTWRMLFRKPYKILLASLANLLVLLFTVIEGVQMTESQAAVEAAMASRLYTGTLVRTAENSGADGEVTNLYLNDLPIGEDAEAILAGSPYVRTVYSADPRTARIGGGKRYGTEVGGYIMVVGRISGEPYEVGNSENYHNRVRFRPTYLAAGDPDSVSSGFSESYLIPTLMIPNQGEPLPFHHDERYFVFGSSWHAPKAYAGEIRVTGLDGIIGEEPGDEALSDEEFAAKVIERYGFGDYAERMNDVLDMTSVVMLPTADMLLPWRNGLMRLVSGRALTEADEGKKVCMFPSSALTALGKRVGDKVLLAVSDHYFPTAVGRSGIPSVFEEYDPDDFGPMEEYEVVGTYANDESYGIDYQTAYFQLSQILIPRAADTPYVPVESCYFSFTVHKDDYESYLFETEPLLKEAGYDVIMARPEYAEVETDFEELRAKTWSTFLTAGLALAVGLTVAAGSFVFFWRGDYLAERRLGARKWEAAGFYCRAYGFAAAVSLAFSAFAVFLMGATKLVPFLAPENLTSRAWGNMALFALSELLLYAVLAFLAVRTADRRKIGG